jgi:flavin-dependent dehydrogenase
MKVEPEIGDATGLIKTFTGGGIYGIGKLLFPLVKWMSEGESADYNKIRKALHKDVTRQYRLTRLLEVGWPIALNAFRLLKDREFQAIEEFDSHSKLLRLLLPL